MKTLFEFYEDNYLKDTPVVEEGNTEKKLSYTMLDLTGELEKKILDYGSYISDSDLYDGGVGSSFGREDDSHITLLYGIHSDSSDGVKEILEGASPFIITLGDISYFESDDYDVMKIDVTSDELMELNEKMQTIDHDSTYPEYKPHVTIAYVNKDFNKEPYDASAFNGIEYMVDSVVFINHSGDREVVWL